MQFAPNVKEASTTLKNFNLQKNGLTGQLPVGSLLRRMFKIVT